MSDHDFIVRQEDDLLPTGKMIAVGVIGLVVTLVGIAVSVWLFVAEERTPKLHGVGPMPSAASDQIDGIEQTLITDTKRGERLNEEQREALRHYRWVNRADGIATIPIERAIDLALERGAERK